MREVSLSEQRLKPPTPCAGSVRSVLRRRLRARSWLGWRAESFPLGARVDVRVCVCEAPSWCETLFSGAQQQHKGQRAQTEAEEAPAEQEEELLPSEGDGALAQAAQGGAVESPSLEIFQPRLDAVLCSLLWVTLLGQGVGLGDPQRALPTPNIL